MGDADHRRFEKLLEQGKASTDRIRKTHRGLLATLTSELNLHELRERGEDPSSRAAIAPETRDIVLESFEEHHVADLVAKELSGGGRDVQSGARHSHGTSSGNSAPGCATSSRPSNGRSRGRRSSARR